MQGAGCRVWGWYCKFEVLSVDVVVCYLDGFVGRVFYGVWQKPLEQAADSVACNNANARVDHTAVNV